MGLHQLGCRQFYFSLLCLFCAPWVAWSPACARCLAADPPASDQHLAFMCGAWPGALQVGALLQHEPLQAPAISLLHVVSCDGDCRQMFADALSMGQTLLQLLLSGQHGVAHSHPEALLAVLVNIGHVPAVAQASCRHGSAFVWHGRAATQPCYTSSLAAPWSN